jgi:hypothetical protein
MVMLFFLLDICSHGLFISPFVHHNPTIQNSPTSFHLFLYIKKKDEREIERERREKEKIKTEIRPSQFQTAITFDKKLRLRRATWLQKA